MGWDFCDLRERLRSWYFASDRDISLQPDRGLYLGDGTQVTATTLIPIGFVGMWSGNIANLPDGWQLCDGTPPTPDLRGMFVVGAGGSYSVGDTGGQDSVDLAHTHNISGSTASDAHSHGPGTLSTDNDTHDHTWSDKSSSEDSTVAVASNDHTHDVTTGATDLASGHNHGPGTLATGAPSDTYTVANQGHAHDVSGTTSGDTHNHDVTGGTTASDSHSHGAGTLASDSQLSAATENRPVYYALAFIMRIS